MYIKGLLENWDIEVTTRGSGAIYSAQLNLRFITKYMRIITDNISAFCTTKVYIHTSRSRYLKHVPFKGFKVEMESCLNVFKILGL